MKTFQIFFGVFILIACLGVILRFSHDDSELSDLSWDALMFWKVDQKLSDEPEIEMPKGGVKGNALALHCFKLQLQNEAKKNIVFSPLATGMLLNQWSEITSNIQSGLIQKLLEKNGLTRLNTGMSNSLSGIVMPIVDSELALIDSAATRELAVVPFTTNRVQAVMTINNWVDVNTEETIKVALPTASLTPHTQLISLSALSAPYQWLHPMHRDENKAITFYDEESSSSYYVNTIRMNAPLRYLNESDFLAVALFFKTENLKAPRTCLLIIMPKYEKLRSFAQELELDRLNAIRQLLATTDAIRTELRMPSFQVHPMLESQKELFTQLGLGALFDTEHGFGNLSTRACKMQDVWQIYNFQAIASKKSTSSDSEYSDHEEYVSAFALSINRPFIWMLTDLTTDAAPQLMGVVEKL